MNTGTLAITLSAALALTWACSVNRVSDTLKCTDSTTCTGGRTCEQGYCVEDPMCPSPCQCDMTTSPPTCTIMGGTNGDSFSCPAGMHCIITCPDTGSCGSINCGGGGTSCTVACEAPGSCGSVSCQGACACDVMCAAGDCGSLTCPRVMGNFCTQSGTQGEPCDSSVANCDRC